MVFDRVKPAYRWTNVEQAETTFTYDYCPEVRQHSMQSKSQWMLTKPIRSHWNVSFFNIFCFFANATRYDDRNH